MTQEEKLEEAKRLYKTANADQRYVLESLFPELKESEDERTWIINYLNNRILNSTIITEKENLKKAIAWLEKQCEQKPAEWSEEDKAIIDYLLQLINNSHKEPCTKGLIAFGAEAWLKSLRPHSQWKPSDEQMKALSVINVTGGISYAGQGQELINLYNDLKKLKE